MPSSPTIAWARYYAQAHWRSFPVWPGEKRPMYAGWQRDATTDADLIGRYFANPEANIGLVCGEAFEAWDIEVDHVPAFSAWLDRNGYSLPEGPLASTGRGGIHFLAQPTVGHTRKLYLDGTHIGELKSSGGFILVCPSFTEQLYRWTWLPERLALPVPPTWLLDLAQRPATAPRTTMWRQVSLSPKTDIAPLVVALRGSAEGDRNAMLHWAANRACDDGIPQDVATRELMAAFMEIRRTDESEFERQHEGRATIASAYAR